MTEKEKLKAKADAFFEVGHLLKYEYEGLYDQSSIEEFFNAKADGLILRADKINKITKVIYKGYAIKGFRDGTFDIEKNGELIDGSFKSVQECKKAIDGFDV